MSARSAEGAYCHEGEGEGKGRPMQCHSHNLCEQPHGDVISKFGGIAMRLAELVPDLDVLTALEPDELGLRLLPWIAEFPEGDRQLAVALNKAKEAFPGRGGDRGLLAIREAWAWLTGAALLIPSPNYRESIVVLSRRAAKLAKETESRNSYGARHLSKESLNPVIREDVWALYHRGKYDTAVFEAMKAVEVAVREASGLKRELGVALMRKAFDKTAGPLADMNAEEGEREMLAHLFAGAIGSYKNPHSHRRVLLEDADEAAEIIMLANHLLRIVSARAGGSQP